MQHANRLGYMIPAPRQILSGRGGGGGGYLSSISPLSARLAMEADSIRRLGPTITPHKCPVSLCYISLYDADRSVDCCRRCVSLAHTTFFAAVLLCFLAK